MKTVREIQAAAGALWPDIDEALNDIRRQCAAELQSVKAGHATELANSATTKDTEIAALKAAAETTAKRTARSLADATALLDETSAAKLKAGITKIIAFGQSPEKARRIDEKEAALAQVQAELDTLKAAL